MHKTVCILILAVCFLSAASPVLCAEKDFAMDSAKSTMVERKKPSFLHRPKKQSPGEQIEYANSLRDAGRYSDARSQYLALVHTWGNSTQAPIAQLEYARLLEKNRDYLSAFDEYEYLIQNYAGGFSYAEVIESEFRIANCVMTSNSKFLGLISNSAGLEKALPLFEKIVVNGPMWQGTAQAQFNIGWINEQLKIYDLAIAAYETVQQTYPASKLAADAAFLHGRCLFVLARENSREERASQLARAQLQKFIRVYPKHEFVTEASGYMTELINRLAGISYERALFYDKDGKRQQSALIAYMDYLNKFPDSDKADSVRKRIDELQAQVDKQDSTNKVPEPDTERPVSKASGSEEK